MGEANSSITRVRPFFQCLFRSDPTGASWLPALLKSVPLNADLATKMAQRSGRLSPALLVPRTYTDRALPPGKQRINLEACFEKPFPPPTQFLRWLIEHPDRMTWPNQGAMRFGQETQKNREALLGKPDTRSPEKAKEIALAELDKLGAKGSARKWWAFEGFTEVDCVLETDTILLFIEGKRTEWLSPATQWYPMRNQLCRNLEVAREGAGSKEFAVLVISEKTTRPPADDIITQSFPHLQSAEREQLRDHWLGCLTWEEACQTTGIDYKSLPKKVSDVVIAGLSLAT
jgi:hypothetical protein